MRLSVKRVEIGEASRGLVEPKTESATPELTPLDDDQSIEERILSRAIAVSGVVIEYAAEHREIVAGQEEQFKPFLSVLEHANKKLECLPEQINRNRTPSRERELIKVADILEELFSADLPAPNEKGLICVTDDILEKVCGGPTHIGPRVIIINEAAEAWLGCELIVNSHGPKRKIVKRFVNAPALDSFRKVAADRQDLVVRRKLGVESFPGYINETSKINDFLRLKSSPLPHPAMYPAKMSLGSVLCILSALELRRLQEQDSVINKNRMVQITDIYSKYLANWGIIKQPSREGPRVFKERTVSMSRPGFEADGALCVGGDGHLFFSEIETDKSLAIKICQGCAAKTDCLESALENNESLGIWGGKTETERRRLRRQRNAGLRNKIT